MNKITRLDIIRNAVIYGEHIPYQTSDENILYWWKLINDELFDGVLKTPHRIIIKKFKHDTLGWCKPFGKAKKEGTRKVSIGISSEINNLYTFLCILVHEMVHAWEWLVMGAWDDNIKHGKLFYSWREKVKDKFNIPLMSSYVVKSKLK